MIQPLRKWHARAFAALAIVLPITFGSALMVRPRQPKRQSQIGAGAVVRETQVGWTKYPITTRIRATGDQRYLQLTANRQIIEPDVLVYLSDARPNSSLPQSARLLGSFHNGSTYALPSALAPASVIVLYSAARGVVLDSAPLGVLP